VHDKIAEILGVPRGTVEAFASGHKLVVARELADAFLQCEHLRDRDNGEVRGSIHALVALEISW
jgi:hypothetical protein